MIPLTHLFTTRETSEKLKKAGCPQSTLFRWIKNVYDDKYYIEYDDNEIYSEDERAISAYTETELGVLLKQVEPEHVWVAMTRLDGRIKTYTMGIIAQLLSDVEFSAQVLLHCIEHKLVDVASLKLEV